MSNKKVIVPLRGTNVKKDDEEKSRNRGRPPKHDVRAVATKSIAIIQTIDANKRQMYMVAVAYFDSEFVAYREGERVRLQKVCRTIGRKARNSMQENYKGLLDRCKLKYEWMVNAAGMTPEGRLPYLARMLWETDEADWKKKTT